MLETSRHNNLLDGLDDLEEFDNLDERAEMKKGSVILFILAICTYCNAASQPDQNLDSQKQSLLKMAAKMLDLNPDKCKSLFRINIIIVVI